jgi:thiamine-phosphate pyrophosphorylase
MSGSADEISVSVMPATLADAARRLKPSPARVRGGGLIPLPRLIVMTDRARLPDPAAVAARLPRGSLIILRDYDAPDRRALGEIWRRLTRQYGLLLSVAADPALALALKADGLHWPQALLPHRRSGRKWLVTASAHDHKSLKRAARAGVDLIILSPVCPTQSHPGGKYLGLYQFRRLIRAGGVPIAALGGLNGGNVRHLTAPRPAGFAGIGAFRGD